jgi:DNA replicative helicase MCM subunit Mcm2 (Cdc46/Mcm family)
MFYKLKGGPMELRVTVLLVSMLFMSALAAEEVVISGIVLDTRGEANKDKPLGSVIVEILDPNGMPLSPPKVTLTQDNGMFHIRLDDKDKLTGKETIKVDAAGYSSRPTLQQIRLRRPTGMKLAYQGEFLLTNIKAIREDPAYREAVVKNAVEAQAKPDQAERTRKVFASFSTLPGESKTIAFGSVRALSSPAFSELLKIDNEVTRARELGSELQLKGSLILPLYEPKGTIRFTGPVTSKDEMDAVLKQAGEKGFKGNAIINDMRILRP